MIKKISFTVLDDCFFLCVYAFLCICFWYSLLLFVDEKTSFEANISNVEYVDFVEHLAQGRVYNTVFASDIGFLSSDLSNVLNSSGLAESDKSVIYFCLDDAILENTRRFCNLYGDGVWLSFKYEDFNQIESVLCDNNIKVVSAVKAAFFENCFYLSIMLFCIWFLSVCVLCLRKWQGRQKILYAESNDELKENTVICLFHIILFLLLPLGLLIKYLFNIY